MLFPRLNAALERALEVRGYLEPTQVQFAVLATEANGRDLTPWPDGGAWDARLECNDGHFSPAPVGSYAANRFGVQELIGNLSEWVQDCRHDSYDGAPADGSAWEQGGDCGSRLVRGGTFVYGPPGLRSANRTWSEPTYRVWYQGFRVVEDR